MVPTRPLFYLSLPGLALVIGLCWFHRRKTIKCDSMPSKEKNKGKIEDEEFSNRVKHSNSLNITKNMTPEADNYENKLGKSTPINIVPNGKSTPVYMTDHQIDTEILKVKILESECKALTSIQEDFECISSPANLPDSNKGKCNSFHIQKKSPNYNDQEPVVVKATKSAKISPENSFAESKYTEKEQNNTCSNKMDKPKESKEGYTYKNEEKKIIASPQNLYNIHSPDSGKGSSLPHSDGAFATIYEFLVPNSLVGQLYGKKHSYLNKIRARTGAKVILRKHSSSEKVKICQLQGSEDEINAAISLIRARLPMNRYPNLTMQKIHIAAPQTVFALTLKDSQSLQLRLVEGINNDVVVSSVVSGGHIFVQQPLHPSHPYLSVLQAYINENYENAHAPYLPEIAEGAICVAKIDQWYRVQIVRKETEEGDECLVRILDFGGYAIVSSDNLRQIRGDFLTTPFQAIECLLSNIAPIESQWTPEATEDLSQLTNSLVLQAQVAGYSSETLPEIYLFARLNANSVIFINRELVARKLAKWIES